MQLLNIKQKLLLFPLLLVTIPVVVIAIISFVALNNTHRTMRDMEMGNNAGFMGDSLRASMNNLHETTKITARNGRLTESVYYYVDFGGEREPISLVLQEIYQEQPLDMLLVTNRAGLGLADRDDLDHFNFEVDAALLADLFEQQQSFVTLTLVEGTLMMVAVSPIHYLNNGKPVLVGALVAGRKIGDTFLQQLKGSSNLGLVLYFADRVQAASDRQWLEIMGNATKNHRLHLGQKLHLGKKVARLHLMSETRFDSVYVPLFSRSHKVVGHLLIGIDDTDITQIRYDAILLLVAVALSIILLAVLVGWRIGEGIMAPLRQVVQSSSSEIAASVNQQDRIASQQAAAVAETKTTMESLESSLRQSAEQADKAAQDASHSKDVAIEGTRIVEEMLRIMHLLQENISDISLQISQLNQQSGKISEITGLVAEFANETKVLSMNAAVEAVRAGEYGKGFAVLATEIRKLAEESKQSAAHIKSLASGIRKATESTVVVTNSGITSVEEGVRQADATSETFSQVVASAIQVLESVQGISHNVRQQAVGVEQVANSMESLNSAARENASGISRLKTNVQELHGAAQGLKGLV